MDLPARSNPLLNPFAIKVTPGEVSYASGSSSGSNATRSRRSNRSSGDEEVVDYPDGFIEEDLRAGGPGLCEEPCHTIFLLGPQYASSQYAGFHALNGPDNAATLKAIRRIGKAHNVEISEISFCGRRSNHLPTQPPQRTALLLAHRYNPEDRGWIVVAREVFALLGARGINDVVVEIIDPNFGILPNFFPCMFQDEIFSVWPSVGQAIISSSDLRDINTIGCYRIGYSQSQDQCPVTVILGVNRRSSRNWKIVRESVLQVLADRGLQTVSLLLWKDECVVSGDTSSADNRRASLVQPVPGDSIAPEHMTKTQGTIGGWIELLLPSDNTWISMAVTCCHVAIPDLTHWKPQDRQLVKNWLQNGVKFNDSAASQKLLMNCPSRQDVTAKLDYINSEIEECREMPLFDRVETALAKNDFVIPLDLRMYQTSKSIIEALQTNHQTVLDFMDQPGLTLGHIAAASSMKERLSERPQRTEARLTCMDWALIMPREERIGNNQIGNNQIPEDCLVYVTELGGFRFTDYYSGLRLCKVGWATGFTRGHYGALEEAHIAVKTVQGKKQHVVTWEQTLLSASRSVPVVKPGDAGSFVFDNTGFVVGLLFGGNDRGNVGYFTVIEDVLQSMKEATGTTDIRLRGTTV